MSDEILDKIIWASLLMTEEEINILLKYMANLNVDMSERDFLILKWSNSWIIDLVNSLYEEMIKWKSYIAQSIMAVRTILSLKVFRVMSNELLRRSIWETS